ncbi:hypothetical protein LJC04_05655 [Ruminococcaceae bacterium OttesenSCG-928-O06]|nr:hypothetical protein [Ruminococcaceae bacterium OttesenSCG-928-O06]
MRKRLICTLTATAAFALMLSACAVPQAGGSSQGGSSAPPSTSSAPASTSAGVPQPPSEAARALYETTKSLPAGPYILAGETDFALLEGAWFHFYDPAEFVSTGFNDPQPVLMHHFWFDEAWHKRAFGVYGTDAGEAYCIGQMEYLGEGTFQVIGTADPEGQETTIKFRAEWPPEDKTKLIITLLFSSNPAEEQNLEKPMLFIKEDGISDIYTAVATAK